MATIEVGLTNYSQLNPQVGDTLTKFIDVGPFVVIDPNEKEKKVIQSFERVKTFKFKFCVADGTLSNHQQILVLAVGVGGRTSEDSIRIVENYKRGAKRYDELYEILNQ